MIIVPASVVLEYPIDGEEMLKRIEKAGRVCYKSEALITEDSSQAFLKKIMDPTKRHESVIEHVSITARFIVDRGVTHEIVRHRIASYSQESTRFCNYDKEKFGKAITVVDIRHFMDAASCEVWMNAMIAAEAAYFMLLKLGNKPQIARSVLPNSLKTEIVMTCNVREWRHFFSMRAAKPAHPQMREVACKLLKTFREEVPILFDDVGDPDCAVTPIEHPVPELEDQSGEGSTKVFCLSCYLQHGFSAVCECAEALSPPVPAGGETDTGICIICHKLLEDGCAC